MIKTEKLTNLANMSRFYLLLCALLWIGISLHARCEKMTELTHAKIVSRVTDTDMVSFPGGKCMIYRLYLRDKDLLHSPYSLDAPEMYLSRRSIERRKHQNLKIDLTDLPVSPSYIDSVRNVGVDIVGKSKWNNTLLVRIHKERDLRRLEGLSFISRKVKVFSSPDSVSERKRFNYRRELSKWDAKSTDIYGTASAQIKSLKGEYLHEKGFSGNGMMVAVFDGGFMNVDKIPALHGMKLAGVMDFVVPKSRDIFQEMEHGTMVLSTMAANVPNYYVGVAPQAEYLLVRCEDERTESLAEEDYWAEAAEYADSVGVDIINSSLGYHAFDDEKMNHTYSEQDGVTALISHSASLCAEKGIVCVNSAGNDGMGSWKKINFPADAKDILTVGSVNEYGVNAPFCAVGPTADGRIKPDVMAYGSPTSVITGRGSIINDNGTSFSAPLIAGMVACLWQALPQKTARQIIKLVKLSSDNQQHPDNVYGYGVPDFWKAYQIGKAIK